MKNKYNIYYSGKLLDGFSEEQVKNNILQLLKLDESSPAYSSIKEGKKVLIKKNIDIDTVKKYQSAFKKIGAILDLEPFNGEIDSADIESANVEENTTKESAENKKSQKKNLFDKIETEEQALKIIKDAGIAFIGISILSGIIFYFVMPSLLWDSFFLCALGILLITLKSKIVSIILVAYSGLIILITFLNMIGVTNEGGNNIILACIIFYLAIRSVHATSFLNKLKIAENGPEEPAEKPGIISIIICICFILLNSFLALADAPTSGGLGILISYLIGFVILGPLFISSLFCIPKKHRNNARLIKIFNGLSFFLTLSLLMQIGTKVSEGKLGLKEGSIEDAKNATVFIHVATGNEGQTGTGFLVNKKGDQGLIVTNAHVIESDNVKKRKIDVVFNSGTNKANILDATVIGNNVASDLAFLLVESKTLPKPIPISNEKTPSETEQLFIIGFPFGTDFTTNRETPTVTVSKGSISSLKLDENDQPFLLQIDGDINPGNSGGPIVNSKGLLEGVSVSTVTQTNIAFAIPPFIVGEMLDGVFTNILIDRENTNLIVSADKIDPFGNYKNASLIISKVSTHEIDKYKTDNFSWKKLDNIIDDAPFFAKEGYYAATFKSVSSKNRSILHGQIVLKSGLKEKYLPPFQIYNDNNQVVLAGPNVIYLEEPDEKSTSEKKEPDEPTPPVQEETPLITEEPEKGNKGNYIYPDHTIENVVPAANGKYLVLHLSDDPQIAIFNTETEKIEQQISLKVFDIDITANRENLFILDRERKMVHRYRLDDVNDADSAPLPVTGEPGDIATGSNSQNSPLIIMAGNRFYFIDPVSLKKMDFKWQTQRGDEKNGPRLTASETYKLRVSPGGQYFTFWGTRNSPAGINLVRFQGKTLLHKNEHKTAGYLVPMDLGNVLTDQDGIYSNQLTQIGHAEMKRKHLIPVLSEELLIKVNWDKKNTKAGIYRIRGNKMVFDLGKLKDMNVDKHPMHFYREPLSPDKRYYWFPEQKKLITIPYSNDKIALFTYD